jgi:hypothetical protein
MRQGSLKFIGFGTDDQGRTTLAFKSTSRGSPLLTITLSMRSVDPVTWVYGYVIRDERGIKTTYRGRFGDPRFDKQVNE